MHLHTSENMSVIKQMEMLDIHRCFLIFLKVVPPSPQSPWPSPKIKLYQKMISYFKGFI